VKDLVAADSALTSELVVSPDADEVEGLLFSNKSPTDSVLSFEVALFDKGI